MNQRSPLSPTVSVIIVNWNGLELLKEFLPSVVKSDYSNLEILLADNASDDGSSEWVRDHFPTCRIIRFSQNYGYCEGNNRAATEASGEVLVFLNNDVEVTSHWIRPLVEELQNPDVAAVQPKIRSTRERSHFDYAGAAGGFIDQLGYPFCRGRVFNTIEEDRGQYDEPADIFWASGAALAIRKDHFLSVGGFDSTFRFHMEEIDLCWRLQNLGYRIRCRPDSLVYHLGGGSLNRSDPRKTFYNFRNSLLMIWKNANGSWLKRNFLFRLILDGVAGLHAMLKGNIRDAFAIFRAHVHFYSLWRRIHRERNKTAAKVKMEKLPSMLKTSIVGDYFFSGLRTFQEITTRLHIKEKKSAYKSTSNKRT